MLRLKPGITGLSREVRSNFHRGPASIKYANEEEILAEQKESIKYNDKVIYPVKVRINLEYLKHQNFWLDLKIIVYTIIGKRLNEKWM